MTYEKAVELAEKESIYDLDTAIQFFGSPGRYGYEAITKEKFNLAARDALIDLIRFCGPEETQKCIEIANLKKFGE